MRKVHSCGCITEDYKDGVKLNPCEYHLKSRKWIYMGLQHPKIPIKKKLTFEQKAIRWIIEHI